MVTKYNLFCECIKVKAALTFTLANILCIVGGFFFVKIATVLNVAQFYLLDQSKLLHSFYSQNKFSFRVDWESKDSYRPTPQLEKKIQF